MRFVASILSGITLMGTAALAFAQVPPPPPPPPSTPPGVSPPTAGEGETPEPATPSPKTPAPPPNIAPPPALPAPLAPLATAPPAPLSLAGWHGSFYIRDSHDYFRIYHKMRIQLDFQTFLGKGVDGVPGSSGGNAYRSRLFIRRMNFEMAGEFLKRWTFFGGVEISQAVANVDGRAETYASAPGVNPTSTSARFQAAQTASFVAAPDDVWINFTAAPWLQFQAGQYLTPFTMENRTSNKFIPFMERHMGIRSFALQSAQEIGIMAWGEIAEKRFNYEVGVFAGEGGNKPQLDDQVDFIGRVFAKPFLNCKCATPNAQIGLSARRGVRNPSYVAYDYAPVVSGQGVRLWNPQYKGSLGRNIHVIPSGVQSVIGGELRLPISKFDLRGEAYYVANNTREAVEGYQISNTERLGQVRGVGWYVQFSGWPFGDAFVNGDPGLQRPVRVDFTKEPAAPKRGLEVLASVGGVQASYDGAARKGDYDANTPGNPSGKVAKDISVLHYGLGLSYWHSSYVRTSINYIAYHTPGSGSAKNLAQVPGNAGSTPDLDTHLLHELGARVAINF